MTKRTKKNDKVLAWHFAEPVFENGKQIGIRLDNADDRVHRIGRTLVMQSARGPAALKSVPILCNQGMHASLRIRSAFYHSRPGDVLCFVEVSEKLQFGSNKLCGRKRKLIAIVGDLDDYYDLTEAESRRIAAKALKMPISALPNIRGNK